MFVRFVAGPILAIAVSQTAVASEWRYCLAPSSDDHKVYLSGAFATNAGAWKSDELFDQALIRAGLHHDVVQCPRADNENAITIMLKDAVSYNEKIGRKIIYVRWEPAS